MAIIIADTKLETTTDAWYHFYVDTISDISGLPTSQSTGSAYSVKKYARPLSVAYCIAEARQYMLDSHDKWRPMYGLSDDVLDALDVKASDLFGICSETKNYKDEAVSNANSAAASAAAALNSQKASSESERNAATSEANSLECKNASEASKNAALESQNKSKQSETAANASASAALVSQKAAKESETNAKSSQDAAKISETNAASSATSAKSSQKAAAASETASKTSAEAADLSQTNALESEKKAKSSETAAQKSEQSAANSATAASSSEKAAAASEAAVKASATAAAESQTRAAESEKNAKTSETAANESAASASASAKNADSSAATATNAATTASEKSTVAKESADNAAASAKAAEQSEANAKIYSEKAQLLGDSYKGWYQTEKNLSTDIATGKNGEWAIIGESDTIWVWDGDTGAWVNTQTEVDLSDYLTQEQINALLASYMPLRAATASQLGGIKAGDNITVGEDGKASVTKGNVTAALGFTPANEDHSHLYAGSSTAGGTANSVNGFKFKAQTSDPGAGSALETGTILFVYS